MAIPEFEIEPPPIISRRFSVVWYAIFLIISFLAAISIGPSIQPTEKARREAVIEEATRATKYALLSIQSSGRVQKSLETLGEQSRKVEPYVKTDAKAAELYFPIRYQLKNSLTLKELDDLKAKKEPTLAAMWDIYSKEKLSAAELKEIQKRMPKNPNMGEKLALVHAREKSGEKDAFKNVKWTNPVVKFPFDVSKLTALYALGGFAVLVSFFINVLNGSIKPRGFPSGPLSESEADGMGVRFLVYLGLFIGVQVAAVAVLPKSNDSSPWISVLILAATLVCYLVFVTHVPVLGKKLTLGELGIRTDNFFMEVVWGVCGAAACWPLLLCTILLSNVLFPKGISISHPIMPELMKAGNIFQFLPLVLTATVLAPILEELTFRGALLPALHKLTGGIAPALLIAGLAFSGMHPTGIETLLPLAVVGMAAGTLSYYRGSTLPNIVMHAVHNAMTLILALNAG